MRVQRDAAAGFQRSEIPLSPDADPSLPKAQCEWEPGAADGMQLGFDRRPNWLAEPFNEVGHGGRATSRSIVSGPGYQWSASGPKLPGTEIPTGVGAFRGIDTSRCRSPRPTKTDNVRDP
jgi:hypothetical protein